MQTFFRLYSDAQLKYNSSVFDMISGDRNFETKQTKGLAYIFSQYPEFLLKFLESDVIFPLLKQTTGLPKSEIKREISSIEVSAERISTTRNRADIVIKIDSKDKPLVAIIIEAKSIGVDRKSVV